MIKVCYRLWVDDGFISELPREQNDFMYGIDEDCDTKKDSNGTVRTLCYGYSD